MKSPTTPAAVLSKQDLVKAKKKLESLKKQQNELREQELEIRQYLADVLFPEEDGSKTFKIDDDLKVTVKRTLNYSITTEDAELLAAEQGDISVEVLAWSPRVKVGGFKEHIDKVAKYITVKPGPPTVEFK